MGKRSRARERAFQILFQIDLAGSHPKEALEHALSDARMSEDARAFTVELVNGTIRNLTMLDELISRHIRGWTIDRMVNVDRSIVRLAAFEIYCDSETPFKVIINEAVELAKKYGTDESGIFVNGILGAIVKELGADRPEPTLEGIACHEDEATPADDDNEA